VRLTASEARRALLGLVERVAAEDIVVHISSRKGRAVLISAERYDSLAWKTERRERAPGMKDETQRNGDDDEGP